MAMRSDEEFDPAADPLTPPIENEVEQWFMAVKYGLKVQISSLLEHNKDFANVTDNDGNYPAHWAAKSGNAVILAVLKDNGGDLDAVAKSKTGMRPIHWAASEGRIEAIRYLLSAGVNCNSQDAAGCTPLVIAAQHDQINTVVFLMKHGADASIVDTSGDTALHWAAYKGNLEITGLLTYLMGEYIDRRDTYGQTPLHLATIKGHVEVVMYLVEDCKQDCLMKDGSGLTCIQLATNKKQYKVEWALRKHVGPTLYHIGRDMGWSRFFTPMTFKSVVCGNSTEETGVWAWRTVFFSNLLASYLTLAYMQEPILSDMYWSQTFNLIVQCFWWFCFLSCLFISPGRVIDRPDASGLTNYDRALDLISSSNGEVGDIKLCHSCHVQRPLRSKHDKFLRYCVPKFDHHCPFVGNTIGRDNHRFFLGLAIAHQLCFFGFVYMSLYYGYRAGFSWFLILFMIYAAMWDMMMVGLGSYHFNLISSNMTTNESINISKGSAWANIYDTLFPYKYQFFSRQEVMSKITRVGPMVGRAPGACCNNGHDHSHGHGHHANHDSEESKRLLDGNV